jgi:putative flippase GtrA
MRSTSTEFIRFVFVGAFNSFLTYVFYVLLLLFLPYMISYTVSYLMGIFLSYYLNSTFVFKKPIQLKKALEFPLVYLAQYLLGALLLFFLVDILAVNRLIAPILIIILTLPVTFLLSRFIVKGRQKVS